MDTKKETVDGSELDDLLQELEDNIKNKKLNTANYESWFIEHMKNLNLRQIERKVNTIGDIINSLSKNLYVIQDSPLKQHYINYLKNLPYNEYLKTKYWKKVRGKMLKDSKGECQACSATNKKLHIHHKSYAQRAEEGYFDLLVVCEDCHKKIHS